MTLNLWYIQTSAGVQGPFPAGQVAQYVELGRLGAEDKISPDGVHWVTVAGSGQFKEVLEVRARALAAEASGEDASEAWARERALAHLRWADERGAATPLGANHSDTRAGESVARLSLRQDHDLTQTQTRQAVRRHPAYRYAGLAGLVLAVITVALWYGQHHQPAPTAAPLLSAPDCTAAPAAYVNWQGCDKRWAALHGRDLRGARLSSSQLDAAALDEADLSYADLRRASLRGTSLRRARLIGADLSGADLTGADLSGAVLDYAILSGARVSGVRWLGARLGKTVWVDGRTCAPASIGACS